MDRHSLRRIGHTQMKTTPAHPNPSELEQNPSRLRLSHRWFRARANPLYLLLYIAFWVGGIYGQDSQNLETPTGTFFTFFVPIFYLAAPFSDAYMYKDRRRNGYLGIWSLFTFGFSGLVAQYITSERRLPHETSHFSLTAFRMRKQIDNSNKDFHGDAKLLDLLKKRKQQKKEKSKLSTAQRLQDKQTSKLTKADNKAANKTTKKQAKLNKKNDTRNKRIEASHQYMDAIQLFNRWLRARRNPTYGILWIALIFFVVQQRGWALAGYLIVYIIVILPLQLTSDVHMGNIRSFDSETVLGGSLLTLGLAGVITQYATLDGSKSNPLSLANPVTFLKALGDPDRERRKQIVKRLEDFIRISSSKIDDLSFSDIDFLCQTSEFTEFAAHEDVSIKSFLETPLGESFNKDLFQFWLRLLRERLQRHEVTLFVKDPESKKVQSQLRETARTSQEINKALRENNFKILRKVLLDIPQEVEKKLDEYNDKLRREKAALLEAAQHKQQLEDTQRAFQEEQRLAIERGRLPQLRIQQLGLPIPRFPSDPYDFEYICRDWLEAWGDSNATVTQAAGDSGIDVETDHYVAQSKFYAGNKVSRPELQQLAGAAQISGKYTVFFAFSGYTNEAHAFADQIGMALFNFNTHTIQFDPVNSAGTWVINGLAKRHLR